MTPGYDQKLANELGLHSKERLIERASEVTDCHGTAGIHSEATQKGCLATERAAQGPTSPERKGESEISSYGRPRDQQIHDKMSNDFNHKGSKTTLRFYHLSLDSAIRMAPVNKTANGKGRDGVRHGWWGCKLV